MPVLAGNYAHVMMVTLSRIPGVRVTVYAPHKNHGKQLEEAWANDKAANNVGMRITGLWGEVYANMDSIKVVHSPNEAFHSGTECVILPMPTYAFHGYLRAACPRLAPGAMILALPGVGGFEWAVKDACIRTGTPMADFTLAFSQESPLACRTQKFGKEAWVIGNKPGGIQIGCIPSGREVEAIDFVRAMHLDTVHALPAPALQVTLGTSIMVGHVFAIDVALVEMAAGEDEKEFSKCWHGKQDKLGAMDEAASEWKEVARLILELYSEKCNQMSDKSSKRPPINWDLADFRNMWAKWYPMVGDEPTLAGLFSKNPVYVPLKWPFKPSDADGLPKQMDFQSRYFEQDVPFGACLVKLLALAVKRPVPTFDACIQSLQRHMGKEYIDYSGDEAKPGKDLREALFFMPWMKSRECDMDEFLSMYVSPAPKRTISPTPVRIGTQVSSVSVRSRL